MPGDSSEGTTNYYAHPVPGPKEIDDFLRDFSGISSGPGFGQVVMTMD